MTEFNTIGKRTQITVDAAPTQNSTNPVQSGGVYTALAAKQATLTFDSAPTQDSVNPVTSGGVYTGLAAKQDALTFDSAPSSSSLNPVTSQGIATALSAKVDTTAMYTTDGANGQTAQNPIALRDFVNSSVATNTANFIATYNVVNLEYPAGTSLTTSATQSDVVNALNLLVSSESISPTNNDYCFVYFDFQDDPGNIDRYDRYKYVVDGTVTPSTATWAYEYTLNNSSFTATQWNAINSGITSGKVTTYDGYASGKQNTLVVGTNLDSAPAENSTNPVTSGGVYSAISTAASGKIDTAGTGLSKSGTTLNHSNSVTAETTGKGSATAVPVIKYDAQGHITSVTTATIYPPTTAGTSGQYWKSDGSGAGVWQTLDTTVASGSANAVTSGAVYTACTNGTVTKVGTATKGSTTQPIYLNAGVPTAGTSLKTGAYKNITISTADPSGGSDGDVWIKYS